MKFVKWFVVLLVAIPVVFVAGIYVRNKAIGPVGWAEDNTIKALKEKMKDPDSMAIRSSFVIRRTDERNGSEEIFICGIVDGRNSFGGYAGGTRFASRSVFSKALGTFDTYSVEIEDWKDKEMATQAKMQSSFEKFHWNKWCLDFTIPPPSKSPRMELK